MIGPSADTLNDWTQSGHPICVSYTYQHKYVQVCLDNSLAIRQVRSGMLQVIRDVIV